MSKYILRLDDASPRMDKIKWQRVEKLLDKWKVKPLVGIIPNNKDRSFNVYEEDINFWNKVKRWVEKDWSIAMHGYDHVYVTNEGGINPVNYRSEFAGLPLSEQEAKIKDGIRIMESNGIKPNVFFAPSHTFDNNTLLALKENSNIRIISDTIATDIYFDNGIYFIPQQSGSVRELPFKIVTFCYHPNIMDENSFNKLEDFLKKNNKKFVCVNNLDLKKRKKGIIDRILSFIYMNFRYIFK